MTKSERLRKITQACLFQYPSFGEILSYIPQQHTSRPVIAATDGRSIHYGDDFFANYTPGDQAFIMLHEAMHVALCHAQRCQQMIVDSYTADIWNTSTDCVINDALSILLASQSEITVPKNATTFQVTLTPEEQRIKPLKDWTSEHLFQYLMEKYGDKPTKRLKDVLDSLMRDLSNRQFDDPLPSYVEQEAYCQGADSTIDRLIWGERIKRALAGTGASNVLARLEAELPKVTTPWQQELRRFVTTRVLPQRAISWKRPSRLAAAGVISHFEPYRGKKRGARTIAVLFDTSGSCFDPETFAEFVANVQDIQAASGADILLIAFDWEVQNVERICNDGRTFSQKLTLEEIKITGGGGTSFVPPFKELEEHDVDVTIVLTDGYGKFPEMHNDLSLNTIWAMTTDVVAPFGKTIELQKY